MIEVNISRHPANTMVMLKSFVLSNILPKIKYIPLTNSSLPMQKEFEDTKGIIRIRK
jgi:hypothetical protein